MAELAADETDEAAEPAAEETVEAAELAATEASVYTLAAVLKAASTIPVEDP